MMLWANLFLSLGIGNGFPSTTAALRPFKDVVFHNCLFLSVLQEVIIYTRITLRIN